MLDKFAIYIARESDGYSHFQGRGYLVVTNEELYFERQLDSKIFIIPLKSIIDVGKTKRLGGQNPLKPMLKVEFMTDQGESDTIAWSIKKLDHWIDKIDALCKNSK